MESPRSEQVADADAEGNGLGVKSRSELFHHCFRAPPTAPRPPLPSYCVRLLLAVHPPSPPYRRVGGRTFFPSLRHGAGPDNDSLIRAVSPNSIGSTGFRLPPEFRGGGPRPPPVLAGRHRREPRVVYQLPDGRSYRKSRGAVTRIPIREDKEAGKALPIIRLLTISKCFAAGHNP